MTAFKGKFGFYPCDWQTYRKLKEINKELTRARHQKAAWERWERKQPHNRVIRPKLRDSNGRVVGYAAPIPMPEPKLSEMFCHKYAKKIQWDKHGVYHKDGIDVVVVDLRDAGIKDLYSDARYPVPHEEMCSIFSQSTLQMIDELYAKLHK